LPKLSHEGSKNTVWVTEWILLPNKSPMLFTFATIIHDHMFYRYPSHVRDKHIMKNLFLLLPLIGGLFLFSNQVYGQRQTESYRVEQEKQQVQNQKSRDDAKMSDLKDLRNNSKVKAKEARRIEKDANSALRESKKSIRAEKSAQKARANATKQAEKASKAKIKSDSNR
jgi:flagellar biosynthesis GTPase FlhF